MNHLSIMAELERNFEPFINFGRVWSVPFEPFINYGRVWSVPFEAFINYGRVWSVPLNRLSIMAESGAFFWTVCQLWQSLEERVSETEAWRVCMCVCPLGPNECLSESTGAIVADGEVYFPYADDDPCYQCTCVGGQPENCVYIQCTEITVCKDGSEPYKEPGECCVHCPEDDEVVKGSGPAPPPSTPSSHPALSPAPPLPQAPSPYYTTFGTGTWRRLRFYFLLVLSDTLRHDFSNAR